MYLLDTNVLSELRKVPSGRADPNVATWSLLAPSNLWYTSAIVVLELTIGVHRAERKDPEQGSRLRRWLEFQVIPEFTGRILPVDLEVAERGAALMVPDPMAHPDALIAATCLVHDLTLVTRNLQHFDRSGIRTLNPWLPHRQ